MRRIFIFFYLSAFISIPHFPLLGQVNGDWVQSPINGHFYNTVGPDTWVECRNKALAEEADLATIRSQAENDWAYATFSQNSEMWFGFTDQADEGNFSWISGEPVVFTNWAPGEPNDSGGGEDYVTFAGGTKWNDGKSGTSLLGLVEKPGSLAPLNSILPNAFNLPSIAATETITLSYDSGAEIVESALDDWITINSTSIGDTSGTVEFSVEANYSSSRQGVIYVNTQEVLITQTAGSVSSLSPTFSSVSSADDLLSFDVVAASSETWSVSTVADWISVTSATLGAGNSTVNISIEPNYDLTGREGIVAVNNLTYTVNQAGSAINGISPTSQNISSTGGAAQFSVDATVENAWLASSNSGWIAIQSGSEIGTGSGAVNLWVSGNDSSSERIGTISVAGVSHIITQAASGAATTPSASPASAAEGEYVIGVTGQSDDFWRINTDDNWINVLDGSGSGGSNARLYLDENSGASRTGVITFNGQQYTIFQSGTNYSPITYSGRISVDGTAPSGFGSFKFSLVSQDGSKAYWNSDGTSESQIEPGASTFVSLDKGFFETPLMIPESIFDNKSLFLRIWFNDGTNGWQQLSPDKPFSAVPYAVKSTDQSGANYDYWREALASNRPFSKGAIVFDFHQQSGGTLELNPTGLSGGSIGHLVQISGGMGLNRHGRIIGSNVNPGAKVVQLSDEYALLETGRIIRFGDDWFEWAKTSDVKAVAIVADGGCRALLDDGRIINAYDFDQDPRATPNYGIDYSNASNPAVSIGEGGELVFADEAYDSPLKYVAYRTNGLELYSDGTVEVNGQVFDNVEMIFGNHNQFAAIKESGDMVLWDNGELFQTSGYYVIDVDWNDQKLLAIPK